MRATRLFALFLLVALFGTVAIVSLARYVDPVFSPMMAQRWVEAKWRGEKPARIQHEWVDLGAVPRDFLRMLLVSEDARFFRHDGFDWIEVGVAWRNYREKGKPLRGASTVTMQCARSQFLWQGRSWGRKFLEAYLTVFMEALLGKERILELYVNAIELGPGVYGVGAASRHHFGRPLVSLEREEMALLAAMPPNPLEWNPVCPDDDLLERKRRVLRRMEAMELPKSLASEPGGG